MKIITNTQLTSTKNGVIICVLFNKAGAENGN